MVDCRCLKLSEYTFPTSPDCVYMRQIDVEMRCLRLGVIGSVTLNTCVGNDGKKYLLWSIRLPDKDLVHFPVFIEDLGANLGKILDIKPANEKTFLYKDDRSYIVHRQKNGRMNLRLLTLFWHQSHVDAMCRAQGYKPQEIYLVRLLDLYSRQELGICWQIVYTDGESEDNGMILAVDLNEAPRLANINLNQIDYISVATGEYVNINNVRYRVFQTDAGSYFLGRTFLQVSVRSK